MIKVMQRLVKYKNMTYDLGWEASVGTLVIEFFHPLQWAHLEKLVAEILAWSSILTILLSNSQTTVVILKINASDSRDSL